ncbi:MAG: PspA/IM30 family protein [Balneolaceae bacterium]|jgi:phage shock protein A|nr:PspA/IM30 family protein [Balneolaceae bacterium]
MFKRFIRAIKSMFGGMVSSMEDPKLILEQNIRELNDQIPQMNENIATVKANAVMLRKEVERNDKKIQEITSKIKAAINADRDDLAQGYALQLEKVKESLEQSKQQLKYADQAYEKAIKVKQAFMREKDRKIKEAREALRASERAEWQSRVADALESFEMGGLDQTHSEMVNKLNEQTARNEARMEIALESVDTHSMEIEANAEKIRAQELVNQFKQEMGKETASKEKKTIEIEDTPPKEKEESQKTIGKEKTKS